MSNQAENSSPRRPVDRLNAGIAGLFTAKSQADLFQSMCDLAKDSTDAVGVALISRKLGNVGVVACSPPFTHKQPEWLTTLGKTLGQSFANNIQTIRLDDPSQSAYGIYVPLFSSEQGSLFLAAFVYGGRSIRLQSVVDMLQLVKTSVLLLDRMHNQDSQGNTIGANDGILLSVIDILGEVQRCKRFFEAANTLCASLASTFKCRRVGLGIVGKHTVKLVAIDQMENFSRGTRSVRMIEEAMQEAADQAKSILYTHDVQATMQTQEHDANRLVTRATAELAILANVNHVLTIPLLETDKKNFILLFQIDNDEISPEDNSALHLIGKLVAPSLQQLYLAEELPLKKLWQYILMRSEDIFGPRRTMLKLASSIIATILLLLLLFRGDVVVSASMVIEGVHSYTHTASMDSYLAEVYVRPGDEIKKGDILGRLDAAEINLEIATLEAQRDIYESQAHKFLQEGNDAEAAIARQEAARTEANLRWATQRLAMTELKSNVEGFLVSEDLLPRLGQPVQRGQALFEITDTASLRLVAHVAEEDIRDITTAMTKDGVAMQVEGEFTLTAYPDMQIPFFVERVHPYATVMDNSNGFEVRGRTQEVPKALVLRPGMEGHAKIIAGEKPWLVLLMRKLVNKIRLLWWRWI